MPPELAPIIDRVARLRADAALGEPPASLLDEIEDALSEGYAWALAADAWSLRAEQRLHELMCDADVPNRGRKLRALARQHARFEYEVIALRSDLAELRHDRDRLMTGSRVRSP